MIIAAIPPVLAASWPWGPPGAGLLDVLLVYGLVILLIALVIWNAASAPAVPFWREETSSASGSVPDPHGRQPPIVGTATRSIDGAAGETHPLPAAGAPAQPRPSTASTEEQGSPVPPG